MHADFVTYISFWSRMSDQESEDVDVEASPTKRQQNIYGKGPRVP